MRFTLAVLALSTALTANAKTFRYREFVPANQDCAQELSAFKTRFESQTGAKVVDSNCALVSIPGETQQDDYNFNAATLIYDAKQELHANSVAFGHGLGGYDSVGQAGDIGGSYDHLADCTNDIENQKTIFRQETKADPVAAYCVAPSQTNSSFNMQIDSFQPLAKRLFLLEAFHNFGSDEDRRAALPIVQSQGVTVARSYKDWVFFYDTADKRSSNLPTHMNARSVQSGLYNSLQDCQTEQPKLAGLMAQQGFANYLATCTGDPGVVSLELLAVNDVRFNELGASNYASVAECEADSKRLDREASSQHGFMGGVCTYKGVMDPLHAYGYVGAYRY